MSADQGGYVYRFYNSDDVLLYVGSTKGIASRVENHAKNTRWWDVAARFDFEKFATLADARQAELEAIRSEFPRWNIHDRALDHPDGPATTYRHILANYPGDCRWGMGQLTT